MLDIETTTTIVAALINKRTIEYHQLLRELTDLDTIAVMTAKEAIKAALNQGLIGAIQVNNRQNSFTLLCASEVTIVDYNTRTEAIGVTIDRLKLG